MLVNVSVTSKALWYIESHLNEELSLEAIADAAGVSKFHLSRAFSASVGGSLAGYLRARRLSEAAKQLAGGAPDILAVALEAGYGSHEAFTRAFRQQFGVTPEQLRSDRWQIEKMTIQEPLSMHETVSTPVASPRLVASEELLIFGPSQRCERVGDAAIPSLWSKFVPYLGQIQGQIGRTAYGVIYNSADSDNYDYLCGVAVTAFPPHPAEFTRLRIPAQTYAVFEHRDHISAIAGTFKSIWDRGLTGLQAVDAPTLEVYGEQFDGRTGLGGLEIWVPVKAR
jgi:AraC family transcriptional regulator